MPLRDLFAKYKIRRFKSQKHAPNFVLKAQVDVSKLNDLTLANITIQRGCITWWPDQERWQMMLASGFVDPRYEASICAAIRRAIRTGRSQDVMMRDPNRNSVCAVNILAQHQQSNTIEIRGWHLAGILGSVYSPEARWPLVAAVVFAAMFFVASVGTLQGMGINAGQAVMIATPIAALVWKVMETLVIAPAKAA